MNIQEFRTRTEKFLSKEEIERYGEDFEPAYMAAGNVDKDDFCASLKNPVARRVIVALTHALASEQAAYKTAADDRKRDREHYELETSMQAMEISRLRKALSLIASTCDRAMAENG